jgi:hypothetical protein
MNIALWTAIIVALVVAFIPIMLAVANKRKDK